MNAQELANLTERVMRMIGYAALFVLLGGVVLTAIHVIYRAIIKPPIEQFVELLGRIRKRNMPDVEPQPQPNAVPRDAAERWLNDLLRQHEFEVRIHPGLDYTAYQGSTWLTGETIVSSASANNYAKKEPANAEEWLDKHVADLAEVPGKDALDKLDYLLAFWEGARGTRYG